MGAGPFHDDELVEAIALRVAELVERPTRRLMTVDEVAEMLRVSPDWVRDHADELGVFRLGSGPVGRLRFDRARVLEAIDSRTRRPERRRAARRARAVPRNVELLPVGLKR